MDIRDRNRPLAWCSGWVILVAAVFLGPACSCAAIPSPSEVRQRLVGCEEYIRGLLARWNVPGIGLGIVVDGKLVLAQGYGLRDVAQKLPFTSHTLFPIGSNTKLFTAVAAGLLVQDGSLTYDRPIRESEPSIRFYNDALNDNVSLRDMLAHRTGITRHDTIWYATDRTAADLYGRLRYLEPAAPLRTQFLYNNLMYAAVGRIIEIKSGQPYPDFIRRHILQPLAMNATVFSLREMQASSDYALPYNEHRDSSQLFQMPFYDDLVGLQAAGAMISNLDDLSHWLIALMDAGRFGDRQMIPVAAIQETLVPALALRQADDTPWTDGALLGTAYGLARFISVYRGHLLAYHGGHIDGYRAQISLMPNDRLGVIVLVMGEHTGFLYDAISFNIYERLLGLSQSAGAERLHRAYLERKLAARAASETQNKDRAIGTHPSHVLSAYVGEYVNPAYGTLEIRLIEGRLQFGLNHVHRPLVHFHYDRFDTEDDEADGKQSLTFMTSSQGMIDRVSIALDESDVVFVRRGPTPSSEALQRATGNYVAPGGTPVAVERCGAALCIVAFGSPDLNLIPYAARVFRIAGLDDTTIELKEEGGLVTGFYRRSPDGEYFYRRQ